MNTQRWPLPALPDPQFRWYACFQLQLEYYEKIEGKPLTLEGKANQLAEMLRGNLPQAMQGLVVVPIFAGFDHLSRVRSTFSVRHNRRPV